MDLSRFNFLPEDIQRKILLELSPNDLINVCLTQKDKMEKFCDNDIFWRLKIQKDFPEDFYYYNKNNLILKNPKNTYIRLFTREIREFEKILNRELNGNNLTIETKIEIKKKYRQTISALLNVLHELQKIPNYPASLVYKSLNKNLDETDNKIINLIKGEFLKADINLKEAEYDTFINIIKSGINSDVKKFINLGIMPHVPGRHLLF